MIGIATKEVVRQMRRFFEEINKELNAAQKLFIIRTSMMLVNEAKKNISKSVNKDVKIKGLSRTGALLNSIRFELKQKKNGFSSVIGSDVKYAAMQEFGGLILPKRAKKLFIPISRKGQREGPSRNSQKSDLVWGKDFVLARRAKRKPKPYLYPAFEDNIDKIVNILAESVSEAVEKASK
jgi:phage gpG-like protein